MYVGKLLGIANVHVYLKATLNKPSCILYLVFFPVVVLKCFLLDCLLPSSDLFGRRVKTNLVNLSNY